MKKTVLLAALILTVFSATAYVGYEGPEDQPHALGATGSAGASQAVSPNGTEWRAEFSMTNAQCLFNQTQTISNLNYSQTAENYSVSFQGTVETANPCQTLEHDIVETGEDSYRMKIKSVSQNGTCVQCLGAISYKASFTGKEPFKLEVVHDGNSVRNITHPELDSGSSGKTSKGALSSFFSWLGSFF